MGPRVALVLFLAANGAQGLTDTCRDESCVAPGALPPPSLADLRRPKAATFMQTHSAIGRRLEAAGRSSGNATMNADARGCTEDSTCAYAFGNSLQGVCSRGKCIAPVHRRRRADRSNNPSCHVDYEAIDCTSSMRPFCACPWVSQDICYCKECNEDADCPHNAPKCDKWAGVFQERNHCVESTCGANSDCSRFPHAPDCIDGKCQAACAINPDCKNGLNCVEGVCREGGGDGVEACDDYTCSSGWVSKTVKRGITQATNENCCSKTCQLHACTWPLVAIEANKEETDPTDDKCCEATCNGYQCPKGFAQTNTPDTNPTVDKCCKKVDTCGEYTCDHGWVKIAGSEHWINPSNQICCKATCASHQCSCGLVKIADHDSWHYPSDETCCHQASCNTHENCPEGYVCAGGECKACACFPAKCSMTKRCQGYCNAQGQSS